MSDPGFSEFYSRIDKIEKARAKGFGFEAAGTLGRSFYTRRGRRFHFRIPLLRQMLALLICGTVIKALFLQHLGIQPYQTRVDKLMAAESGIDRLGGWLMQADPVTMALAQRIGWLLRISQ